MLLQCRHSCVRDCRFRYLKFRAGLARHFTTVCRGAASQRSARLTCKGRCLSRRHRKSNLFAKLQSSVQGWSEKTYTDLRESRKRLAEIAQQASKWSMVKAIRHRLFFRSGLRRRSALIKMCSEVRPFVVSKGELESWMDLGVSKGKEWNRKALQELHEGRVSRRPSAICRRNRRVLLPSARVSRIEGSLSKHHGVAVEMV